MLLVLEVKVTSFGLLAVGGIVSLVFGSMMLIDSPLPELQIGLRLIVPVTLALSGIILFLVRLGLKAQHQPAGDRRRRMLGRRRAGADVDRAGRRRAGHDPRRDLDRDRRPKPSTPGIASSSHGDPGAAA